VSNSAFILRVWKPNPYQKPGFYLIAVRPLVSLLIGDRYIDLKIYSSGLPLFKGDGRGILTAFPERQSKSTLAPPQKPPRNQVDSSYLDLLKKILGKTRFLVCIVRGDRSPFRVKYLTKLSTIKT
jgi:hypothetical protein